MPGAGAARPLLAGAVGQALAGEGLENPGENSLENSPPLPVALLQGATVPHGTMTQSLE